MSKLGFAAALLVGLSFVTPSAVFAEGDAPQITSVNTNKCQSYANRASRLESSKPPATPATGMKASSCRRASSAASRVAKQATSIVTALGKYILSAEARRYKAEVKDNARLGTNPTEEMRAAVQKRIDARNAIVWGESVCLRGVEARLNTLRDEAGSTYNAYNAVCPKKSLL